MHLPDFLADVAHTSPLFWDDFRAPDLDRTKWNVKTTGPIYNNEQQAYVDSDQTIYILPEAEAPGATHGALVIHPRWQSGHTTTEGDRFDFVSGRIDTRDKFDFCYGTAAARLRLPVGDGLWPAFWAVGYGRWPHMGEIDIMEFVGETDWTSAAVHGPGYSGEAGLVNKKFFTAANDTTQWHTYAVTWSPDRLIFTVDGQTIYRVTRAMTDFFGPWVFDNNKFLILNFALGGTYPFKTNGVQTPYHGLPQETVQAIQANQIRIMVDWVGVWPHEATT